MNVWIFAEVGNEDLPISSSVFADDEIPFTDAGLCVNSERYLIL